MSSPTRWGSVFDRLNDPVTYTGVYAERFRVGPGINQDTDASIRASEIPHTLTHTSSFSHAGARQGSPGAPSPRGRSPGGYQRQPSIKDLSQITRPHLNSRAASPTSPSVLAAERTRARYAAAEASFWGDPTPSPSVPVSVTGHSHADMGVGVGVGVGADAGVEVPLDTNTQLQLIFQYYCRFGRTGAKEDVDTIDSFNFMKFVKECPDLLDALLTPTEVDLIFVKCKAKHARRLTYGQFLDALSAMAAVKYHEMEDAAEAFSTLLANHVFQCPASLGIAAALKSGMLRLSKVGAQTPASSVAPHPVPGLNTTALSSAAASVAPADHSRSSGADASTPRSTPGPVLDTPRMRPPPKSRTSLGSTAAAPASDPEAAANAAALLAAATAAGFPYPPPPYAYYPWPFPYPTAGGQATVPPVAPDGSTPATAMFAGVSPPADVYEAISRKAMEMKIAAKEAGASTPGSASQVPTPTPWPMGQMPMPPPGYPWPWPYAAAPPGYPWPPAAAAGVGGAAASPASPPTPSSTARGRSDTTRSRGLPTPATAASMRMLAEAASPRAASPHGANASSRPSSPRRAPSLSALIVAAPADISARPRSPRLSRSPSRSTLGTPDYRPSIAGSANKPGSVHERLASPASFTGVYRRAWMTDGRINHFADTGVSNTPSKYVGNTNTGTDETIHDIRFLLRPNLGVGKGFR